MVDFTKVLADISAQKTLLQGVVVGVKSLQDGKAAQDTLIQQLRDQLAQGGDPAAVQATIDQIDQSIQDNSALVNGLIPAAVENTQTPAVQAQQAIADTAPPAAASADPAAGAGTTTDAASQGAAATDNAAAQGQSSGQ